RSRRTPRRRAAQGVGRKAIRGARAGGRSARTEAPPRRRHSLSRAGRFDPRPGPVPRLRSRRALLRRARRAGIARSARLADRAAPALSRRTPPPARPQVRLLEPGRGGGLAVGGAPCAEGKRSLSYLRLTNAGGAAHGESREPENEGFDQGPDRPAQGDPRPARL